MSRRRKKNYWKLFSIALLIGAVAYGGYLIISTLPKQKTETNTAPSAAVDANEKGALSRVSVTAIEKKIIEKGKDFSVNVAYPALAGVSEDKAVTNRANDAVKTKMTALIANFKANSAPEEGVLVTENNSLDVSYDKNIVSTNTTATVVFHVSEYFSGAAHPNSYDMPVTVSRTTGLAMSTRDFFKTGANYVSALASAAIPKIKAKIGTAFFAEGAEPTNANYDMLYPTENGIVIIFNPYQVAAYAAGVVTITIPREEIKDVLK